MRPVDPGKMRKLEAAGREIGNIIGREKLGFALFLFSFEGPEFFWISNASRADMVKALQEFITRNPADQTSEQRN